MKQMPDFISLNGPDNAGKTTQLRQLAEHSDDFQLLGSVHEHDSEPWVRAAAGDYARWWFETSTTVELTEMLLIGHDKRATARRAGQTGLLDRGLHMLLAVATATSVVKDGLTIDEASRRIAEIASSYARTPETSLLLLPSLDAERSYALTSTREGRQWTGIYPRYQMALHAVLLHQADRGTYSAVLDCEGRSVGEVHAEVLNHIGLSRIPEESPQ